MKIGDEVMIHGYIDEIRKDTIIIRNDGGYFGTVRSEVVEQEPCEDAVSRKALLDKAYAYGNGLEPEGYCVNVEDVQECKTVYAPWIAQCPKCKNTQIGYGYTVGTEKTHEIIKKLHEQGKESEKEWV